MHNLNTGKHNAERQRERERERERERGGGGEGEREREGEEKRWRLRLFCTDSQINQLTTTFAILHYGYRADCSDFSYKTPGA